ncbi:MarR family winged helix-turn-helix transcriptional regulator [Nocardiopsis sp. ATB16-24]|uniref:MarR family winged helix-turn-helix transcriptional regulator n=1 Tax=Nocardiopsis sp. ATB16-24 TaxID=3019555 RepID=UPI0025559CF1|nr:MarR family winged helix-turn-helix transcriptional regulator [Nocardiopsis sp. ATB16-24]
MAPTAPEPGPFPDAHGPSPDTNLGWSLAVVLRHWHERVEAALEGVPHGSRGYHVLTATAFGPPPTQAALARRLLIDRSVMTYLLDDLEEAGLVRRRVDPRDRRIRRVCPTEHGREVLARAHRSVEHVEERVLAGLEAPERDLFRRIARQAALAVQDSSSGGDPCEAVRRVVDDGVRGTSAAGPPRTEEDPRAGHGTGDRTSS